MTKIGITNHKPFQLGFPPKEILLLWCSYAMGFAGLNSRPSLLVKHVNDHEKGYRSQDQS
jgi:hypothetical protein